jgi:hypothetical protein
VSVLLSTKQSDDAAEVAVDQRPESSPSAASAAALGIFGLLHVAVAIWGIVSDDPLLASAAGASFSLVPLLWLARRSGVFFNFVLLLALMIGQLGSLVYAHYAYVTLVPDPLGSVCLPWA